VRTRLFGVSRWLLLVLPLLDLALVLSGVLDVRTGVAVGLVLEVLLVGVVIAEIAAFRAAYRTARDAGVGGWTAAGKGLGAAAPPPVAWAVRAETGMVRAIGWAVRGRREVRPGDIVLAYGSRLGVTLWSVGALGALETAVVHILLPWPVARWVLFGVSLYALVWMSGLALSVRQHPHVVRDGALLLRFGHLRTTVVPLAGAVRARARTENGHRRNVDRDGDTLVVSVMGETSVELTIDPPVPVAARGTRAPVARVLFFADDPRAAVRALAASSDEARATRGG
jgi:hypothetical protein